MTEFAVIFLLINAIALLALPRRWAPLPLLAGACYMTLGQGIMAGPFTFTVIRILVLFGVIRVLVRQEHIRGKFHALDWVILAWAGWALLSSGFHQEPGSALIFRLGLVYNGLGIYFLIRVFCRTLEDVVGLGKMLACVLAPVAFEMILEQLTGRNLFAILGGVAEEVTVRNGRLRAQGPFAHGILAGTVGVVAIPLMVGIWRRHRGYAAVGIASGLIMAIASFSSGPVLTLGFALLGLWLWRWRRYTRQMRWAVLFVYLGLNLVMKVPAYYLLGRIDIMGGSTGWHRAELIHASITHFNEWWLAGTDYTRHWMPTGVTWNEAHTDITNHYLQYGVVGGFPLLALFVAAFAIGFHFVGKFMAATQVRDRKFLAWCVGCMLFAHSLTCLSVSYFDQSSVFLFLSLAMAGALPSAALRERRIRIALQKALAAKRDEVEMCAFDPVQKETNHVLPQTRAWAAMVPNT